MTKYDFVFCIITNWGNRNEIDLEYEQAKELADEICKELKLKKSILKKK